MTVAILKKILSQLNDEQTIELFASNGYVAPEDVVVGVSKWAKIPYVVIGDTMSIHMAAGGFEDFTLMEGS
jgi:hypothetical protein